MPAGDVLGEVEFAVLDAVHRGALRDCRSARQVGSLREQPAGEAMLHDVLRRFEHDGLLRSARDRFGRRYELTAAGRWRLRADRRFRVALVRLLIRGAADPCRGGIDCSARGFASGPWTAASDAAADQRALGPPAAASG